MPENEYRGLIENLKERAKIAQKNGQDYLAQRLNRNVANLEQMFTNK